MSPQSRNVDEMREMRKMMHIWYLDDTSGTTYSYESNHCKSSTGPRHGHRVYTLAEDASLAATHMGDDAHQIPNGESRKVSIEDDVLHEAVPLVPETSITSAEQSHIFLGGINQEVSPQDEDISLTVAESTHDSIGDTRQVVAQSYMYQSPIAQSNLDELFTPETQFISGSGFSSTNQLPTHRDFSNWAEMHGQLYSTESGIIDANQPAVIATPLPNAYLEYARWPSEATSPAIARPTVSNAEDIRVRDGTRISANPSGNVFNTISSPGTNLHYRYKVKFDNLANEWYVSDREDQTVGSLQWVV